MSRAFLAALAVGLAACSAPPPEAPSAPVWTQRHSGAITDEDSSFTFEHNLRPTRIDVFPLDLAVGQTLRAEVEGEALSPRLEVHLGGEAVIGDGYRGGTSPRSSSVEFTALEAGTYSVIAAPHKRERRGAYDLVLTVTTATHAVPVRLAVSAGGETEVTGVITDDDPVLPLVGPRGEPRRVDRYALDLDIGQTLAIDLGAEGEVSGHLRLLLDGETVAHRQAIIWGRDSRTRRRHPGPTRSWSARTGRSAALPTASACASPPTRPIVLMIRFPILALVLLAASSASAQGTDPPGFGFAYEIQGDGLRVTILATDGPALPAGLRVGDVVTHVEPSGQRRVAMAGLADLDARLILGTAVTGGGATAFTVRRGSAARTVSITPAPYSRARLAAQMSEAGPPETSDPPEDEPPAFDFETMIDLDLDDEDRQPGEDSPHGGIAEAGEALPDRPGGYFGETQEGEKPPNPTGPFTRFADAMRRASRPYEVWKEGDDLVLRTEGHTQWIPMDARTQSERSTYSHIALGLRHPAGHARNAQVANGQEIQSPAYSLFFVSEAARDAADVAFQDLLQNWESVPDGSRAEPRATPPVLSQEEVFANRQRQIDRFFEQEADLAGEWNGLHMLLSIHSNRAAFNTTMVSFRERAHRIRQIVSQMREASTSLRDDLVEAGFEASQPDLVDTFRRYASALPGVEQTLTTLLGRMPSDAQWRAMSDERATARANELGDLFSRAGAQLDAIR